MVIVITGNEFASRSFRQQVMSGLSRNEWLAGKGVLIFGLALFGFDAAPGAANGEDELFGLRFLFSTFPSLFFLLGALIVWNYPITEERHAEIRRQIEAEEAAES